MKKMWLVVNILLIFVIGELLYDKFSSTLGSTEVTEYVQESNYHATVTFKIHGIQPETNIQVLVINPDHTVKFWTPQKMGDQYTATIKEDFTQQEADQFRLHERPEILIRWEVGNQKRIAYAR